MMESSETMQGEKYMGNPYEAELIGLAADRNHGYNGGCNDGFGFGNGGFGGFILGALLGGGRRGGLFGGDGDCAGGCVIPTLMNDNINSKFNMIADNDNHNYSALATQIQNSNTQDAIRFVDKAVCDSTLQGAIGFGNVNSNIIESRYQNALGDQSIKADVNEAKFQGVLETRALATDIGEVKYQTALQFKDLAAQLAECCCHLEMQGFQNTQKILDAQCSAEKAALQDEIQKLRFKSLRHDCEDDNRAVVQNIGSTISNTITSLLSGNVAG